MDGLELAQWRKSSYSGGNGGGCVEVARNLPGVVAVRDSKDREGPALTFTPDGWRAFLAGVRTDQFGIGQ
jgi:Domain of unknown function (DUF397)